MVTTYDMKLVFVQKITFLLRKINKNRCQQNCIVRLQYAPNCLSAGALLGELTSLPQAVFKGPMSKERGRKGKRKHEKGRRDDGRASGGKGEEGKKGDARGAEEGMGRWDKETASAKAIART